MTYGDSYLEIGYDAVIVAFRAASAPALMTVFRNEGWDRSNVEFTAAALHGGSSFDGMDLRSAPRPDTLRHSGWVWADDT